MTPRNVSRVRPLLHQTGAPGEVAILVPAGEPRRTDRQVRDAVMAQAGGYSREHFGRDLPPVILGWLGEVITADHYGRWSPRVLLTREHLAAYVNVVLGRYREAMEHGAAPLPEADLAPLDGEVTG